MVLVEEMVEESETMKLVVGIGIVQFAKGLQLSQASLVHQLVIADNLVANILKIDLCNLRVR